MFLFLLVSRATFFKRVLGLLQLLLPYKTELPCVRRPGRYADTSRDGPLLLDRWFPRGTIAAVHVQLDYENCVCIAHTSGSRLVWQRGSGGRTRLFLRYL